MALNILEIKVISGNLKKHKVEELTYGKLISGIQKKVDSNDLLEYFLNQYDVKFQSDDLKNNSISRIIMGTYAVLRHIIYVSEKVEKDILDRIEKMSIDYNKYLEENGLEEQEEVRTFLNKLAKYYNIKRDYILKNCTLEQIDENEELERVKKTLVQNDDKVKKLEKNILQLQKELNKKEKLLSELKESMEDLKNKKSQVEKDVKNANKENLTLHKELSKTTEKIVSLEEKIRNYIELNKVLEEKISLYEQKKNVIIAKDDEMQEQILRLILNDSYTLDELVKELDKKNIKTSREEVFKSINLMKKKYLIRGDFETIPKSYTIGKVEPKENVEIKIDVPSNKCIDILLLTDEHIDYKNVKTYDNFDSVYNYCINKNIHTIFHLGDFVDLDLGYITKTDKLRYYMKDVSLILNKYPKDDSITNVYLGGNHEKRLFSFGIDPVEYIEGQRSDFISLGYTHAVLNIGNDKIGLHHPNNRSTMEIRDAVPSYLNQYYHNIKFDDNDVYLDILGHYHRCYLNQDNYYFLAPSFNFNNESINAACHLKIYLDENNNILRIGVILLPTIGVSRKLLPAGELEYKKILK
ncbi:MAG: hypothetical protein ACI31M_02205 [Bacilli bacterium]